MAPLSAEKLRFGATAKNFTVSSEAPDIDSIIAYAQQVEALGLDSVWVWDHILLGSRNPFPVFDSLITLAALSVTTERLRLGTSVLVLPLRNPAVLAKQTATLDRISGGRLTLGVAAGWYQREFDAVGVNYEKRGTEFVRNLRLMYELWKGEPFSGEEGPYRFNSAVMLPTPVQQPRPEVLIGGYVDVVLRRVARDSDGWLNYFYTAPSFGRDWLRVCRHAEDMGRDPSSLTNVSQLPICVADTYSEADKRIKAFIASHFDIPAWSDCSAESAIRGTPEECAEQLAEHVEAGVRHFAFVPDGYRIDQLEVIAREVVPHLLSMVGTPA